MLRRADVEDAVAVVRVYVESWNAGFGSRMRVIEADPARVERWRRDLSNATPTRWWVAERNGSIVGVVGIGPCRDPVQTDLGELDTIAVSPSAWHTGIGKELMAVALRGLRAARFHSAALWTLSNYPLGERFLVATGWRLNGATRDDGNQVRYDHSLESIA
jgi:N-acetylglutamate synthase-like GNAT family acetyltransferase